VTVSGVNITNNSKVDLQPNAATIQQLIDDGVSALYIQNNNGTLTAYAIGAHPSVQLSVQCVVTEVVQ
jgi:DNA/RNA endonuclease YhcR with UshA esterase domain